MQWYKIDVMDNNEVLITINADYGDHKTFNAEFAAKWAPVMAIFTEKYVSEGKLRAFEKAISGYVGKKVEAEINWQPCIRSHAFKALGAQRVTTALRGLHTVQFDYLKEMYSAYSLLALTDVSPLHSYTCNGAPVGNQSRSGLNLASVSLAKK